MHLDEDHAAQIRQLHLNGFGGACFAAGKTINQKVFHGKGKLVGAANTFWLKRGRFLGHVAVLYRGHYWDSDARPKSFDDIEEFGMLDPDDPAYAAPGLDDDAANNVTKLNGQAAIARVWKH